MSSVKVAVRVRPFNGRETARASTCVVSMDGSKTGEQCVCVCVLVVGGLCSLLQCCGCVGVPHGLCGTSQPYSLCT